MQELQKYTNSTFNGERIIGIEYLNSMVGMVYLEDGSTQNCWFDYHITEDQATADYMICAMQKTKGLEVLK